jgi:hypothetical protein
MRIESVPSQKTQANSEYAQRINRVIDYLRGNLEIEWAKSQDIFSEGILFGMYQ